MKGITSTLVVCVMVFSGLAMLPAVPGEWETEPNNDLSGAQPIASGSWEGQVNSSDHEDYFRFNMSAEKYWVINCSIYGDNCTFSILYSNDTTLASSPLLDMNHTIWSHRYIQGNTNLPYYIKAEWDPNGTIGYTNYTIFIGIYDQNDAGSGGDAGDDFDHATNGTLFNPHERGLVGDQDLSDFYFIRGSAGQNFSITFGLNLGYSDPMLVLYNENKTQVDATNASSISQGHLDLHMTYTGLFYLEASSGSNHNGRYVDYYINISSTPAPPQDTTPPRIEILYPTTGMTLNHTAVTIAGWASDDVSVAKIELGVNTHIRQTVAEPNLPGYNWTKDAILSVGENSIIAWVTDGVGLTNSTNITVYVNGTGPTNDTILPWVNITDPTEGQVFDHQIITLMGSAGDNIGVLRVEARVNSHGWIVVFGTSPFNYNLTLDPGRNLIEVRAVDTSGNAGYDNVTVYHILAGNDTEAPHIYIYDPVNGSILHTLSYTVRWNASDNVAVMKVEFKINEETTWHLATPAVPEWTHGTYDAALIPGNNTITGRAMDTSGNTAIHWIWVLVNWTSPTNDTTAPWINITFPANWTRLYVPYTNVTGVAGDNIGVSKVEVRVDTGAWNLATGTTNWYIFVTNIPQGNHSIEARATDTSGLTASAMIWVYYWPDTTPPEVNITSFHNNTAVSNKKVVIRGTVADSGNISRLELFVNGEPVNVTLHPDGTWEATVNLKEGKNTIDLVAYDQAGNSVSKRSNINYNKPKPQPGFEALLLVCAVAAGLAFLWIRRRA